MKSCNKTAHNKRFENASWKIYGNDVFHFPSKYLCSDLENVSSRKLPHRLLYEKGNSITRIFEDCCNGDGIRFGMDWEWLELDRTRIWIAEACEEEPGTKTEPFGNRKFLYSVRPTTAHYQNSSLWGHELASSKVSKTCKRNHTNKKACGELPTFWRILICCFSCFTLGLKNLN